MLGLALTGPLQTRPAFDFCLSTTARFDNKHTRSCLASTRLVAGRGPMAQDKSPRSQLAFSSVLYPGRCLASQPTGSGGERAVDSQNHGPWPMVLAALCHSTSVSSTSFSAPSSSLPSLRGIFGPCRRCCPRLSILFYTPEGSPWTVVRRLSRRARKA